MNFREQSILRNLSAFASSKNGVVADATSIKIRPTSKQTGPSDAYVYPEEYKALAVAFDLHPIERGDFNTSQAHAFGANTVLLEHETGPEIIAFIRDVGEAAGPFLSVVELGALTTGVVVWLRGIIKKNCDEKNPDRYYHDVGYLRVETRKTGPNGELVETVATTIRIDANSDEDSIKRGIEKSLRNSS